MAIAAELRYAIGAIRRVARREVRQDEPLPPAQGELLRLAAGRPGISVADAARELRLAPNTVSRRRLAGWRDLRAEIAARALDELSGHDRRAILAATPALLRFAERLKSGPRSGR